MASFTAMRVSHVVNFDLPAELIEMLKGVDVGVLHDVFNVAIALSDRADGADRGGVVAPHDDLVQRRLSGANAFDDFFVGESLERPECKRG